MNKVKVDKGRVNVVIVELGYDVSAVTFASEVRQKPEQSSTLIMTWTVSFTTDGTDGSLTLTVDDSTTASITETTGYMDIKRVDGGNEYSVWDTPIEVYFQGTVTQ